MAYLIKEIKYQEILYYEEMCMVLAKFCGLSGFQFSHFQSEKLNDLWGPCQSTNILQFFLFYLIKCWPDHKQG